MWDGFLFRTTVAPGAVPSDAHYRRAKHINGPPSTSARTSLAQRRPAARHLPTGIGIQSTDRGAVREKPLFRGLLFGMEGNYGEQGAELLEKAVGKLS
jgi:hypothetical protein